MPEIPPPTASYIVVETQDVPIFDEWLGSVEGLVNAEIRAQVNGIILSQNYEEGRPVKKGDLLFQIDPRPFQADFDKAQANLAQTQAKLTKSQQDLERATQLWTEKTISQMEYDNAVQANKASMAEMAGAKAAADSAALNLEFTKITAPIAGVAGLANAQIGNLVGPASGPLTTLSTIHPIKVQFNINEQTYLRFRRGEFGELNNGSSEAGLELILSDGTVFPHKGRIVSGNRQVDVNTGTLTLIAEFPNPDHLLRPGQYAKIRAQIKSQDNAILIPQRAINELQGVFQVAVINEDNTASIRNVNVGSRNGSNWVITEGVNPGEKVVIEGFQRLKDGATVTPQPYQPPAEESSAAAPGENSESSEAAESPSATPANAEAPTTPAPAETSPTPAEAAPATTPADPS